MVLDVTSIEQVDAPVVVTKVQVENALSAVSRALSLTADHRLRAVYTAYGIRSVYDETHEAIYQQYVLLNALANSMPDAPQWYAVSFGNGNDGVSHSYPDAMVFTNEPYVLARLALCGRWIGPARQMWANEHVEVDGEKEHTISAVLSEGPEGQTEFGAAYFICEVFPVDVEDHPTRCAQYDSLLDYECHRSGLEEAERLVAMARSEENT